MRIYPYLLFSINSVCILIEVATATLGVMEFLVAQYDVNRPTVLAPYSSDFSGGALGAWLKNIIAGIEVGRCDSFKI